MVVEDQDCDDKLEDPEFASKPRSNHVAGHSWDVILCTILESPRGRKCRTKGDATDSFGEACSPRVSVGEQLREPMSGKDSRGPSISQTS